MPTAVVIDDTRTINHGKAWDEMCGEMENRL